MKNFIQETTASLVRFLLAAYGAWLAANGGAEVIGGDPSIATVSELLTGTILAGLSLALKHVDGLGAKGKLVKLLVGSRSVNIAHSFSRWIVGLLSGALASLTESGAIPGDVGDMSAGGLVAVLVGLGYDRVSKAIKP